MTGAPLKPASCVLPEHQALRGGLNPGRASAASWEQGAAWLFGLLLVGLPHCFRPRGATQDPVSLQEQPQGRHLLLLLRPQPQTDPPRTVNVGRRKLQQVALSLLGQERLNSN